MLHVLLSQRWQAHEAQCGPSQPSFELLLAVPDFKQCCYRTRTKGPSLSSAEQLTIERLVSQKAGQHLRIKKPQKSDMHHCLKTAPGFLYSCFEYLKAFTASASLSLAALRSEDGACAKHKLTAMSCSK